MAAAEIIGAAVGVLLLIIVAYVLVGNVLNSADVVINAQKDMTLLTQARTGTVFTISSDPCYTTSAVLPDNNKIVYTISNNGTEIISDYNQTDVFVKNSGGHYLFPYNVLGNTNTWKIANYTKVLIHPMELDPGETFVITATLDSITFPPTDPPNWIQMSTGNGVSASKGVGKCTFSFISISPTYGQTTGNTAVTITGTNFVAGGSLGVKIDGVSATDVTWNSVTSLSATTPPGTEGAKNVEVINGDGPTVTKIGAYTYYP